MNPGSFGAVGRDRRRVIVLQYGRTADFGESEIEYLDGSIRFDFDVAGLQVAVCDAFLVRRFERIRNLLRNPNRFVERYRALLDPFRECRPSISSITRWLGPTSNSVQTLG
jgi:hypothetical protein